MSARVTAPPTAELVPAPVDMPGGRADPRLVALHRAVRAAIVPPATFAFSLLVIRDMDVAIFALFGCFTLLAMADFGGPRRPRAFAYATTTLLSAALVALGTALSPTLAGGVAGMLAVGFALAMAGVFGGYIAASQTALLLAFVLAVTIPAGASAVPARVAGSVLAGIVSTLAGLFFWPVFERVPLRRRAADACVAVAGLVDALDHAPTDELALRQSAAQAAVRSMRTDYARCAIRPAGPTRRDRAFVQLVTELEQIVGLVARPLNDPGRRSSRPSARPCIDEGNALAAAVLAALHGSAGALTGGVAPDLRRIVEARRAHRAALDRWAVEQLRAGRAAEEILDGIDIDHTLRVIAYLTLALGANATIAAGGLLDDPSPLPAGIPRVRGARGVAGRIARTVRAHLDPSSTVLHHSIRMAAGLALSVGLARSLGLNHGFWVVLGTLSVLRSNALGTGRSTLGALAGTVIGFVVGSLFEVAAGQLTILMWIALPVAFFVAAYAASAIGFVAGQAAFTLTVIIVFNLISPAGWQVGLVRIEDVALGTGISVVVGVLLWPRGARHDLARATAGLYRALVAYVGRAFELVLGVAATAEVARVRAAAIRARNRAGEAFDTYLAERGARPLDPQTAGRLVAAGSHAVLAGDALVVAATDGYRADRCGDGTATVEAQVNALLARLGHLADGLERGVPARTPPQPFPSAALRGAAVEGLRRARTGELAAPSAMAVVIAAEWVENLGRMAEDLDDGVIAAAEAARARWWR